MGVGFWVLGREVEAVERREHAEFQLHVVSGGWEEGCPGPCGRGPEGELGDVVDVGFYAVDLRVGIYRLCDIHHALAPRICLTAFLQVMPDRAYFQHAQFLESPRREFLREGFIGGFLGILLAGQLDGGVVPFIFQRFGGAEHGEARAVAGLEGGDERYLRTCRKGVFEALRGVILRVVDVGCLRGFEDGVEERGGIGESLADRSGEGDQAVYGEEVLDSGFAEGGAGEEEDVVF